MVLLACAYILCDPCMGFELLGGLRFFQHSKFMLKFKDI